VAVRLGAASDVKITSTGDFIEAVVAMATVATITLVPITDGGTKLPEVAVNTGALSDWERVGVLIAAVAAVNTTDETMVHIPRDGARTIAVVATNGTAIGDV
jgi:hypothetical protein